MAEDSGFERTEPASPRRLEKAREEGDIPRSRELGACLLLLAAGLGLWVMGEYVIAQLSGLLAAALRFDREAVFHIEQLFNAPLWQLSKVAIALFPLAALLLMVACFTPLLMGGWVFTLKALSFRFERMNPISGLSRMVSVQSLVELLKAIGKTCVVGWVAYIVIKAQYPAILGLVIEDKAAGLGHALYLLLTCFLFTASGLILIVAIDVPYQLRSYANKLKMTRQEVIQENKEAFGHPQIKAKLRAQRREMARRRMMSHLPTADVVITNPAHYAVALKYVEGKMDAPIVVAKGIDFVAARIREVAQDHGIPFVAAPPLARALYAHAELDEPIPEALYTAVAEVLAYVFQLKAYHTEGGVKPREPETIIVPDALDPLKQDRSRAPIAPQHEGRESR